MKPSFHTRLLNNPFDDPGLYVRLLREGRAMLFDSGFTTSLSNRDILKISDIFISHTHVDHFLGFDSILRLHLMKEKPLRIYGPQGFIDCLQGKLKGYTWNIIGGYPLIIEAVEVNEKAMTKAVFKAGNSFRCDDMVSMPFDGILMKDSFFNVRAVILDHQISCLAFSLEEDYHININKAKLSELNLPVGQWLGELKRAIRESYRLQPQNSELTSFKVDNRVFKLKELTEIATITKGQKLSYVVDAIGSEENIMKIVRLVRGSDILFIEAYFLDRDRERARERYHLTAREAGRIAREAGVGKMIPFHFSPKYIDNPEEILKEAEEEFRGYRKHWI